MKPRHKPELPTELQNTNERRLARWKSGTCQMNQAWYLKRCLQHGHDPKPTVWSDHLPK